MKIPKATWIRMTVLFTGGLNLLVSCDKLGKDADTKSLSRNQDEVACLDRSVTGKPPRPAHSKEVVSRDSTHEQALEDIVSRWEVIAKESNGVVTLMKRRELALEAVKRLGASPELERFLEFLTTKGAGELRRSLINDNLADLFSGPGGKEARAWLLTVEDKELREHLSRHAGEMFKGVGFKDYFDETGERAGHNCQAALLAGYCVALAKTDPEGAVQVYKEMGYPKKIDNTGMALVMAVFPPTTDFLNFATDIRDDSMPLAKRSRAALLANWAGVNPSDAAQYILTNPKVVHPDQMGVVIGKWAETAPDAATEWLNELPAGKPRDEGMAALALHWTGRDPANAWQYVASVGEDKKRIAVATEVFKVWEQTDRAAAEKAWVELFPGQ